MSADQFFTLAFAAASAVGTLLATLAAFRSASTARQAQEALIAIEEHQARHAVMSVLANIEHEHSRSLFLGRVLKKLTVDQAVMAGAMGGSRHKAYIALIDSAVDEIGTLAKPALDLLKHPENVAKLGTEDSRRISIKSAIDLQRIRAKIFELERDAEMQEQQALQQREIALQSGRT